MADTLETLEFHAESQAEIAEAMVIGNRALDEDSTSQLHLHQSIAACTKHTMDAREETSMTTLPPSISAVKSVSTA